MSFNHSKSDRNDPAAYRKTGRSTSFNQQRGSSGAHGRGGGGGGGGGGYAPASTSASSLSSSRSFNKKSNNAQGGQPRVNPSPVNSTEFNYASAARITSNGTHVQPQVHGASDGPVTKSSESSAAQRSSRVVSKAPTSQKSSMSSDTAAPPSPAKGGDASNVFSFQFGSISAGVTNGMAIPARTNSAPPNLDEQKRDQARHESYRSAVSAPVPPVPRQQQPSRKDAGFTEQSNAGEPYMGTKFKQDPQVSALTPLNQMQKLSVPASGISMVALPYHQSQASLQFGGPNPQIPSQSLSTASLQMPIPMPLPIGNAAQVQPQVFVQGLQPHPMHPQGIMHQSQNMSFIPHPLSHQLGNMGIGMGHQYSQPQGGKFTGPRKPTPVKITHPDTHQELKLEKREDAYSDGGSSGARSHPNVPSQSQPVKSFSASHPINYYSPSSYNPSSLYYPPSSSLPMTNSLITTNSQPPIFNSPVSHAPQNVGFMNSPSLSSVSVSKANTPIPGIVEPTNVEFSRDVPNMSGVASVTIKSSVVSSVVDSSSANTSVSDVQNSEPPGSSLNCDAGSTLPQKECEILDTSPQQSKYSSDSSVSGSLPKQSVASVAVTTVTPSVLHTSDVSEDSISGVSNEQKRESLSRSNSLKDNQKKPGKKGQSSQHQVSVQSPAVDSVPSQAVDSGISDTGVSESVGTKTNDYVGIPEDSPISETLSGSISGAIETKTNGSGEASACVSSEGSDSGALASGSLNNHMHDKIDESSEGSKDTTNLEANRGKTTTKGKKKRREILQKADAAGSTSDLYNAYKGPEEKKEAVLISQSTEGASISENLKQFPAEAALSDAKASEKNNHIKAEPDDWEDAADMSTPKLKVDEEPPPVNDGTAKKYSRDFLLKFAEQCLDLPEGFEITADIAEALVSANRNSFHVIERDSHPSPGRIVDRPGGMSRMERRGNVATEDDRWSKVSNAFHSGRGLDGSGGNAGFRSGQGGGVLGNPRAQASMQYAGGVLSSMQYAGGVLSGPMQSAGNQGGMQRNNSDGERWQRAPSFQHRGLIPSPTSQTPLQLMHKAEKKYEVGKVSDTEEVKQRQLKGILNKLTPQNFDRLFEQVKAVNIDNAVTLTGVISQIFEKALMEPTFCEMYANFCSHLASELPDFSENNEKITFKRLLLNKCQEEFERGEREQEEANKVEEGGVKQSDEEREAKRVKARRRMLGNIRLIGELYKKRMLTERIMHECIKKLLGQYQDPDEEDVEALCKLMSTIGEMIDHPKAKEHMDAYFERMKIFSNNMNLSSRVRFMLKDAIDLRKNKWQQRRKVEGPKKIEEVHRDAAQERHAQAGRLGRGAGNIQSTRRNPVDYSPRGSSMLPSPNAQMGGLRGLPTQARGYGFQDARFEERQSHEARTLPVLPQRPSGDDSMIFGPKGGLAKGMSRGSTAISNLPTSDVHSGSGDSHRTSTGLNGPNNLSERSAYSSSLDLASRDGRNADRNLDRPVAISPPAQLQGTLVSQNASDSEAFPERLQDLSLSAIREYYSARDVDEVALCVKDLNSPSFHPSMVSLWVIDSFERKDTERDLLAKLLVNLVKSQNGTLNQAQLVKGFESALRTLEDAVNDAPKAPEFLGRIFAKVITESVVSLNEIGQLIHDGGEEPESLLQVGLAADVLGSTLEAIRLEKGDAVLSEIRTSSNLQLETFRPPKPITSRKLEAFI
ncbi:eukaryotic translation initiation factor 4G-like isoform X2 [Lotus japonicus]|uniref:eukaryotic translation initiation factor 4G-like isoform X2 n=1 Tax=Lotus japonicus TaxID=34305 RepID=UPI002585B406|nr:eukaryotic translation initiation factor 4G-like isoform X2 [Lotus japonicus]